MSFLFKRRLLFTLWLFFFLCVCVYIVLLEAFYRSCLDPKWSNYCSCFLPWTAWYLVAMFTLMLNLRAICRNTDVWFMFNTSTIPNSQVVSLLGTPISNLYFFGHDSIISSALSGFALTVLLERVECDAQTSLTGCGVHVGAKRRSDDLQENAEQKPGEDLRRWRGTVQIIAKGLWFVRAGNQPNTFISLLLLLITLLKAKEIPPVGVSPASSCASTPSRVRCTGMELRQFRLSNLSTCRLLVHLTGFHTQLLESIFSSACFAISLLEQGNLKRKHIMVLQVPVWVPQSWIAHYSPLVVCFFPFLDQGIERLHLLRHVLRFYWLYVPHAAHTHYTDVGAVLF